MPILGTIASSFRAGAPAVQAYESIATATPNGTNTVVFSNIPQTFTHLQMRIFGRSDAGAGDFRVLDWQYNGDTGNNYDWFLVQGAGSTIDAIPVTGVNYNRLAWIINVPTNGSSGNIITWFDYRNTNKFKTAQAFGGVTSSTNVTSAIQFGTWKSTAAITSMSIKTNGNNFSSGTVLALYGIKSN